MAVVRYDAGEHAIELLRAAFEEERALNTQDVVEVLTVIAHNANHIAFRGDVESHVGDVAARLFDAAINATDERINRTAGELVLMMNQREMNANRTVDERLALLASHVQNNQLEVAATFTTMVKHNTAQLEELISARQQQARAEAEAMNFQHAMATQSALLRQEAALKKSIAEATASMLSHADRAAAARSEAALASMRADAIESRAATHARIAESASLAEAAAVNRAASTANAVVDMATNMSDQMLTRLRSAEAEITRMRATTTDTSTAHKVAEEARSLARSAAQETVKLTVLNAQLQSLRQRADEMEDKVAAMPAGSDLQQLAQEVSAAETLARTARDVAQKCAKENEKVAARFGQEARRLEDSITAMRASMERDRAAFRASIDRDASPTIDVDEHVRTIIAPVSERIDRLASDLAKQLAEFARMIGARISQVEDRVNILSRQAVAHKPSPPVTAPRTTFAGQIAEELAKQAAAQQSTAAPRSPKADRTTDAEELTKQTATRQPTAHTSPQRADRNVEADHPNNEPRGKTPKKRSEDTSDSDQPTISRKEVADMIATATKKQTSKQRLPDPSDDDTTSEDTPRGRTKRRAPKNNLTLEDLQAILTSHRRSRYDSDSDAATEATDPEDDDAIAKSLKRTLAAEKAVPHSKWHLTTMQFAALTPEEFASRWRERLKDTTAAWQKAESQRIQEHLTLSHGTMRATLSPGTPKKVIYATAHAHARILQEAMRHEMKVKGFNANNVEYVERVWTKAAARKFHRIDYDDVMEKAARTSVPRSAQRKRGGKFRQRRGAPEQQQPQQQQQQQQPATHGRGRGSTA